MASSELENVKVFDTPPKKRLILPSVDPAQTSLVPASPRG